MTSSRSGCVPSWTCSCAHKAHLHQRLQGHPWRSPSSNSCLSAHYRHCHGPSALLDCQLSAIHLCVCLHTRYGCRIDHRGEIFQRSRQLTVIIVRLIASSAQSPWLASSSQLAQDQLSLLVEMRHIPSCPPSQLTRLGYPALTGPRETPGGGRRGAFRPAGVWALSIKSLNISTMCELWLTQAAVASAGNSLLSSSLASLPAL